jgi:hypothetical protein
MLPVVNVGCMRWSATVSGNKTPPVRLLSYNTSLFPSFLQGAKEKGGCRCVEFPPMMPKAIMRPALALHTASNISPSSTRRRLAIFSLIILTALHFPI